MQNSRFISHRGKQIYMLDCTGCTAAEIGDIISECSKQVRSQPLNSVLTLTIAGGGKFDNDTITRLKELTKGNAPYVRKAAVVGITGLYKVILITVSMFSKREFHLFDTREEAMDFLARD